MSENQQTPERTSCVRCGTCCRKSGPTLHREDLAVLRAGHATHHHLVTIRKGERVFQPLVEQFLPATHEVVRICGKDKSWTCVFYEHADDQGACAIYDNRFAECRALKCWDPADLIEVMAADTVTRADLMNPNDPLAQVIEMHETECPYEEVERIVAGLAESPTRDEDMAALTELVRRDLAIRLYATSELGLDPAIEMFAFGRPIFKGIASRGFAVREEGGEVHLDWAPVTD